MPLVGGLAGLFFAVAAGLRDDQEVGHHLRHDHAGHWRAGGRHGADVPEFFGRRGRHHHRPRRTASAFLGITFGPAIQVYYLIAVYCFVCTALMFAFTGTPLGRMLERRARQPRARRVHRLRHAARALLRVHASRAFLPASAGALAAINFEIVTGAEVRQRAAPGGYLLFTFLGGATFFFGPIIGAVLLVLASVLLSETDQGLAALPGPGVPVHGDVRARRHGQPDHDEPAPGQVRQAAPLWVFVPGAGWHGPGGAAGRRLPWWRWPTTCSSTPRWGRRLQLPGCHASTPRA